LIASNFLDSDTITKIDYITVVDSTYLLDSLISNFQATTSRLIVLGETVSFEDLSFGYPSSWEWVFEGGTPLVSSIQHPMDILYNYSTGYFDVQLIVSNGTHIDTLIKENYIVVTDAPWADPEGFCDFYDNVQNSEFCNAFMHFKPIEWGYFPGHNGYEIEAYADKYTNYTITNVNRFQIPVVKAYQAPGSNSKVRFKVWEKDIITGLPGNVIDYKDIPVGNFTPLIYNSVIFDNPIPVNGEFYAGFELFYDTTAQDTFCFYMVPDRGVGGLNTLFVKKGNWKTIDDITGTTINTSLGMQIYGCLTDVVVSNVEISLNESINIYPNPSSDIVYVDFLDDIKTDVKISVFDLYGKQVSSFENIHSGTHSIDFRYHDAGIYIVVIETDRQVVTKKLTIIK